MSEMRRGTGKESNLSAEPRRRRSLLRGLAGAAITMSAIALIGGGKDKKAGGQRCDPAAQIANLKQHIINGKPFQANVLRSVDSGAYLKVFESDKTGFESDNPEQKTKFSIDPVVICARSNAEQYVGIYDAKSTTWDKFGNMTPVAPGLEISQTAPGNALIQQLYRDGGLSLKGGYDDSDKAVAVTRTLRFSLNANVGFNTDFLGTGGAGFIDQQSHTSVGTMP